MLFGTICEIRLIHERGFEGAWEDGGVVNTWILGFEILSQRIKVNEWRYSNKI